MTMINHRQARATTLQRPKPTLGVSSHSGGSRRCAMIDCHGSFWFTIVTLANGATFDRRLRGLGMQQVRTPFRAPWANAISERWVKSVPTEYLDHLLIFNEAHLRRPISGYATDFNYWRPQRSLGQTRCASPPCIGFDLQGELQDHGPARPGWIASHPWACCMMVGIFAQFSRGARNCRAYPML
jgi:hypothetical protein